jgi:hypothetical protein
MALPPFFYIRDSSPQEATLQYGKLILNADNKRQAGRCAGHPNMIVQRAGPRESPRLIRPHG